MDNLLANSGMPYAYGVIGAIALSYPPRVRVRATVKLSAAFFHDESSITIGGYESAIAPCNIFVALKVALFVDGVIKICS